MSRSLRYPIIVFDLDGTLVDSYDALDDAVNRTLGAHRLAPLAPGEVRRYVGEGIERLLERAMGVDVVPSSAMNLFDQYYGEICCKGSSLLQGVPETLESLRVLGVSMVICTNKPTGFSVRILEHLGIAAMFAGVVGPDVAGARKPDARHVRHAIDLVPGPRRDALFVGDMPIDVQAARATKIDVAVLPTGSSSAEELREARPDYFLEKFDELIEVVAGAGVKAR